MISVVVISKDEPALDDTLTAVSREAEALAGPCEIVVVDASQGRLDAIRDAHPYARWSAFAAPAGVRVTIPHQRNAGVADAAGDVIVFTDAGCLPCEGWLAALVAPIAHEAERVSAGVALSPGRRGGLYDSAVREAAADRYLSECPTINLAFTREAFDAVGGFDESFAYGSDIDFSWRLGRAGIAIRSAPTAVVEHEWGSARRQLKRSFAYGRARARLYAKHTDRLRGAWRHDPMVVAYPLFLLGLPLTLRWRGYPLLLLVPALRNRRMGAGRLLVDHLAYGWGVLWELRRL